MNHHQIWRRAGLCLLLWGFVFTAPTAFADETPTYAPVFPSESVDEPSTSNADTTAKSKAKPSASTRTKAPTRTTPKTQTQKAPTGPLPKAKPKKKKKGFFRRMWNGMGNMVPTPIKRAWNKTKRKANQMVRVYRAMRDLVGEDEKDRVQRLAREKVDAMKLKWKRRDQQLELQVRKQMQIEFLQRACRSGSARACVGWSRVTPKLLAPLVQLRRIWTQRQRWKLLGPLCTHLTKRQKGNADNTLCLAQVALAQKKYKTAERSLRALIKQRPDHGVLWLSLGQLYLRSKRHKRAGQACGRAAKLMPQDPKAWFCMGEALGKRSKRLARAAYHKSCKLQMSAGCYKVLALRPKGLRGMVLWTTTRTRLGAHAISSGTLNQSCRLGIKMACRRLAQRYKLKARQMLKYKRITSATWFYRKAIQLDNTTAALWREVGVFFHQRKQWREAKYALGHALRLDSKHPKLWRMLGRTRERLMAGTLQHTKAAYRKACALGDHNACKHVKFPTAPE